MYLAIRVDTPYIRGVLTGVSLVENFLQVDSIRIEGTYPGIEIKKTKINCFTPATLTFKFLSFFTSVEIFCQGQKKFHLEMP